MRNRNILKMILLTIITFGIYFLYWSVSTAREMRKQGADIPNAILIIIPIINIWWTWKYSKGVEHVSGGKLSAVLSFILLYAVGFIGIYIVQDIFNGLSAQGIAANPATTATGGQAQVPGGQTVDPATAAATATGAGVGVAASQVGDNAQAAPNPQPQETPKPPEPEQPQSPEPTEELSTDSQETEQSTTDETASTEDGSLQQPGNEADNPDQETDRLQRRRHRRLIDL